MSERVISMSFRESKQYIRVTQQLFQTTVPEIGNILFLACKNGKVRFLSLLVRSKHLYFEKFYSISCWVAEEIVL